MKFISVLLITFNCVSLNAQNSWKSETQRPYLQKGYVITEIEKNILEIKDKSTDLITKHVDVTELGKAPTESSPTMQVFDLINADTNLFNYKYKKNAQMLVSGSLGYPLVLNDINNNGKLDFIGQYKIQQDLQIADCAIAELNNDSTFSIQKIYADTVVTPLSFTDVDEDSLKEINFKIAGGQFFYNYESLTDTSYPESLNFMHRMWQISGGIGSETFNDLDNDGIQDVVYKGDDTTAPAGTKIFVAEYDSSINNFVKKYSYRPQNWRVSGFGIGDFDNDGFKEFVTGSIFGDVYVFENTGNDTYDFTFSDTISTSNAYLTCSTNDIDNNGQIEFFVGGSSYYSGIGATKVYWFESDGNNNYIKRYTFFLLGTDVLGTTEMYSYDVDADLIDDLVFVFGGSVVILIWNQAGYFELHYLDWLENWDQELQSAIVYDVFNSDRPDLILSLKDYVTSPRTRSYLYISTFLTNIIKYDKNPISFILHQNYPNPFNGNTIFKFRLEKSIHINFKIYDITGKEVIKLRSNQLLKQGVYTLTWDGKNKHGKEVNSGVYFYQLSSRAFLQTKKMLLIK